MLQKTVPFQAPQFHKHCLHFSFYLLNSSYFTLNNIFTYFSSLSSAYRIAKLILCVRSQVYNEITRSFFIRLQHELQHPTHVTKTYKPKVQRIIIKLKTKALLEGLAFRMCITWTQWKY